MSDSSQPHGLQPTRLLHPWDFPGKSIGVGCHCLLWGGLQYTSIGQHCSRGQRFRGITNPLFTDISSSPSRSEASDPIKIQNFHEIFIYVYGWILQILPLEVTRLNLKLFYLELIPTFLYNMPQLHFQFLLFQMLSNESAMKDDAPPLFTNPPNLAIESPLVKALFRSHFIALVWSWCRTEQNCMAYYIFLI